MVTWLLGSHSTSRVKRYHCWGFRRGLLWWAQWVCLVPLLAPGSKGCRRPPYLTWPQQDHSELGLVLQLEAQGTGSESHPGNAQKKRTVLAVAVAAEQRLLLLPNWPTLPEFVRSKNAPRSRYGPLQAWAWMWHTWDLFNMESVDRPSWEARGGLRDF